MIKRFLLGLLVLVLGLFVLMAIRASRLPDLQPPGAETVTIAVDGEAVAARFAEALTFPTISHQEQEDRQPEIFLAFHEFLERSFPTVHATLERETVNELSLLYTWEGQDASLDPVLLMGHQDVVPVIPGTEENWQQPPFGGVIADGMVWGRGALDDKASVMSILEAVEMLTAEGFRPKRTIYLAFGHDEEVGGSDGAGLIADLLADRGVDPFAFVLDEGGFIGEGGDQGIEGKVAVIGIAEKGFVSLELVVEGEGGHSSAPPDNTNLGILSRAVTRLEDNQFPARLDGATEAMLTYIAPEMDFLPRLMIGNLWLTRSLMIDFMLQDRSSAAMVRTTTAVTIMEGGVKENVLPIKARAVVNHRILPGDTVESVTERAREVIDDDRVQVTAFPWNADPSPVSDPTSEAFQLIGRTVLEIEPSEVLIAPYLVIGGTDAKYYSGRSDAVFRFLPVVGEDDVMKMIHGTNERVSIENLERSVRFFVQLIRNTDELVARPER